MYYIIRQKKKSKQIDTKTFIVVILGDEIMDDFYFLLFQNLDLLNYIQQYSLLIIKGELKKKSLEYHLTIYYH